MITLELTPLQAREVIRSLRLKLGYKRQGLKRLNSYSKEYDNLWKECIMIEAIIEDIRSKLDA